MITLGNVHVRPQGEANVITFRYFEKDWLYGVDERIDRPIVYDVRTGYSMIASQPRQVLLCYGPRYYINLCTSLDYYDSPEKMIRVRVECNPAWQEAYDELTAKPAVELTGTQERCLIALATHQISGEQLGQGVKALTGSLPEKMMKCYLGGWVIPSDCGSVEEFLMSINEQGD